MLPGCPALRWLFGLDAEQWAPCVCVTGSLPACAQTDYPVWTSVTLDAHQSLLLLSVVWFQTSGTGQSCVWLTVCVVWTVLPWGQRRWRTRTGVRSLGLRHHCPVGPEAPDRLWPQLTSWRRPWCTAPPGTGTPTCPRGQAEGDGRLPSVKVWTLYLSVLWKGQRTLSFQTAQRNEQAFIADAFI